MGSNHKIPTLFFLLRLLLTPEVVFLEQGL